jgi:hypothetical protein
LGIFLLQTLSSKRFSVSIANSILKDFCLLSATLQLWMKTFTRFSTCQKRDPKNGKLFLDEALFLTQFRRQLNLFWWIACGISTNSKLNLASTYFCKIFAQFLHNFWNLAEAPKDDKDSSPRTELQTEISVVFMGRSLSPFFFAVCESSLVLALLQKRTHASYRWSPNRQQAFSYLRILQRNYEYFNTHFHRPKKST